LRRKKIQLQSAAERQLLLLHFKGTASKMELAESGFNQ
jgi:hypothetical protein